MQTTPTAAALAHPLVRLRGDKIVDETGRVYLELAQGAGDVFVNTRHLSYDEVLTLQAALRVARREIERRRREPV